MGHVWPGLAWVTLARIVAACLALPLPYADGWSSPDRGRVAGSWVATSRLVILRGVQARQTARAGEGVHLSV